MVVISIKKEIRGGRKEVVMCGGRFCLSAQGCTQENKLGLTLAPAGVGSGLKKVGRVL